MNLTTGTFRTLAATAWMALLMGSESANAAYFEDQITHLLNTAPAIAETNAALSSAREGIKSSEAGYYPTITLDMEQGYEHIDGPTQRSALTGDASRMTAKKVQTTITYPLYDGGSTETNVEISQIALQTASTTKQLVIQTTLNEGMTHYLTVMKFSLLLSRARQVLKLQEDKIALQEQMVKDGSAAAPEVLASKLASQATKQQILGYDSALKDAIAQYTEVFGMPPQIRRMNRPVMPRYLLPVSLEESRAMALTNNPQMRSARLASSTAERQVKLAKAGYMPTVDLEALWKFEDNLSATAGLRRDYTIWAKMSWDIFSGFETQAGEDQAQADLQAALSRQKVSAINVAREARMAWNGLMTARDRLNLTTETNKLTAELTAMTQQLAEGGAQNQLATIDAQVQKVQQDLSLKEIEMDRMLAQARLLFAIGKLVPQEFLNPSYNAQTEPPLEIEPRTAPLYMQRALAREATAPSAAPRLAPARVQPLPQPRRAPNLPQAPRAPGLDIDQNGVDDIER